MLFSNPYSEEDSKSSKPLGSIAMDKSSVRNCIEVILDIVWFILFLYLIAILSYKKGYLFIFDSYYRI
jgi:hypothetical protein